MIIDTQKCVYCKACMLICPSKALSFEDLQTHGRISIDDNLCEKNCTKCKDICLYKAIDLIEGNNKKYDIPYSKCENCGNFTYDARKSEDILCTSCKRKINIKKVCEYGGISKGGGI